MSVFVIGLKKHNKIAVIHVISFMHEISRIRITGIKLNDKFDYTVKPCVF